MLMLVKDFIFLKVSQWVKFTDLLSGKNKLLFSLQNTERVLTEASSRCLRCSLFTNKYSKRRHLSFLFPRSFIRQLRSIEKQPEISKPSKFFKFSSKTLIESPVRWLRNLNPTFCNYGNSVASSIMTASSTWRQYERSNFCSPLSIERLSIKTLLLIKMPFLIQTSSIDVRDLEHILRRELSEMKLCWLLMALVLILND